MENVVPSFCKKEGTDFKNEFLVVLDLTPDLTPPIKCVGKKYLPTLNSKEKSKDSVGIETHRADAMRGIQYFRKKGYDTII